MKNYKNNHKRNRFRNNGDRNFHRNGNGKIGVDFTNGTSFKRKNPLRNNLNFPKLIEKYTSYAKEALSNGDKIQYENYLQHADHFTRLQVDKESFKKKEENNISSNNVYSKTENTSEDNKKSDSKDLNNTES
tara:strand:- start:1431 stop:1826 length:396 start_codon:yes stop_codon:yes gene_type:complete